jgi:hypothetical protein
MTGGRVRGWIGVSDRRVDIVVVVAIVTVVMMMPVLTVGLRTGIREGLGRRKVRRDDFLFDGK